MTYNRGRVSIRRLSLLATVIAASCADPAPPVSAPAPGHAQVQAPTACDPTLPAAVCARGAIRRCAGPADPQRVGEWRYALIGPLWTAVQDVSREELLAAWRGEAVASRPAIAIAASKETEAALAPLLGPGKLAPLAPGARPVLDATHWAIVPADALVPAWNALAIDGRHPLDPDPGTALAVPLCAPGKASVRTPGAASEGVRGATMVRNIDPARLTSLAMTGTTALTRGTARMIERHGLDHATRDVAPWLRATDLVHISNEVSMVPDCDPHKNVPFTFCSRESYIKILEDSHARIIELTGSHLTDYGRRWLVHTLDMYRKRGWVWFGGGRDQLEGTAVLAVEHHGNRLGFIGCNHVYTGQLITEGPGPAACDLDRMVWQVGEMRRKGRIPIVSIQHEEVYIHDPPSSLVRDFRRLAEAGAAVVFGSQAHTAHPWEVHHGAFLHYGAGNFYFDQEFSHTSEGVADRLYFHDNRLLAVGRLFTKVEDNGRPRPMTAPERGRFLDEMKGCIGKLARAAPWGTPRIPDERPRPDSFLIGKQQQFLTVLAPDPLDERATYPLVIDLAGTHRDPAAFVVRLRSPKARPPARFVELATELMTAKYRIDPQRVRVHSGKGKLEPPGGPKPKPKSKSKPKP